MARDRASGQLLHQSDHRQQPEQPIRGGLPDQFIAEIVDFCERKKIYLIMDDIYHKLVFDGESAPPAYQFTDKDVESTMVIVVNGVSKLYGMTGFRIGWVVATAQAGRSDDQRPGQITSCTSAVLQAAAEGALTGMQSVVENLRLTFENNRDVIMQELRAFNGVKVTKPDGTFYCPAGFPGVLSNQPG